MKLSLTPKPLVLLALTVGVARLAPACTASGDPSGAGGGAPASAEPAPTSPLPSGDADPANGTSDAPDASKVDKPDASTCVPVTIPPVAQAVCGAAAEAGTCAPQQVTFSPAKLAFWHAHQGVCSTTEIDAFLASCLGSNADPQVCESYANQHADCSNCIMPNFGQDPHGVVQIKAGLASVNITGCIAVAEPCNEPCAQAYADTEECQKVSCAADACDTGLERIACFGAAASCVCKHHRERAKCTEALTGPKHPAAGCLGGTTFLEKARSVAIVVCGS